MKKHKLLLLIIILFIISATTNIYQYTSSVKAEREYLATIEILEQTISEKTLALNQQQMDMAILSSAVTYLAEEYANLYEAYCQCCEPKIPM